MRNQVNAAKSSANKPTSSRAGTTNKNTPSVPKESAEMTAWLRRKDYNPMKSAADARKLQQLKMRFILYRNELKRSLVI
ncbi:unnamed protein product [Anisakis simplex]|uniref:RxLR effector protein n=1 Tax=Anisakis simplex TaxID=6269 RepID=A0A0M3JS81_ANISI|nr:unnamed protein product [Anisakis simplex]